MIIILVIFNIFIYQFDKLVIPTVMAVANLETKAKVVEITNNTILNKYSKQFKYNNVINIHKDNEGNIIMFNADTLKMNKIACDVALEVQKKLQQLGIVGIKIPAGYIFKNNILAYFGPDITIRVQPIGYIETKYLSNFDSAGINQTRHRIYVQVKTNMKVIIPFSSNNLEIKNEVPVCETIIVGKVPDAAIDLGLDKAGFKLKNDE